MKLELKVNSRDVVTPSSPTPPHLKNYKLSFIDQIMPSILMPVVLFYPANNNIMNNSERSNRLKKSLSKALTLFYPLAGRLVGNSYVNCNDEGVTYVEAQVNGKLFDVITDPIPEELSMYLPCDPDDGKDLCLVVQVTFFSCGGVAIMVGVSHKVADAFSIFMFVSSWAAFTRGDERVQSPIFESAVLFPPKDSVSEGVVLEKKENLATKRFAFTPRNIAKLKEKYTTNTEESIGLTRIETLSAFIWARFLVATGAKEDTKNTHALRVFVNIRTRVVPPLSEYHFGNLIMLAVVMPSFDEDEDVAYSIVKNTRDALRSFDGLSVADLRQQLDSLLEMKELMEKSSESEPDFFLFSSLCGFPLHGLDFGWGKPVWIGGANITVNPLGLFMDSFSGGGIDAWVILKKEDMAKFEKDKELLEYVSCGNDTKSVSRM